MDENYISLERAIERMYKVTEECGTERIFIDRIIDELENLPSSPHICIHPLWIPVSERLPGENGDYLVFKGSSYGGWCEVAGFAKDGSEVDEYDLGGCENVWYDYDSEYGYIAFDSVTHWMPLPSTEGLK